MGMGFEPEPQAVYRSFRFTPRYRAFLPQSVDLSPQFPPPGSQGQQGSCTAWATTYALRSYYEGKRSQWTFSSNDQLFSPAFVYNKLRNFDAECRKGTQIPRALDILKNEGAPTLAAFPYRADDCSRAPDEKLLATAARYRIRSWQAIDPQRLDDIKGQLAAGNPVVFGMQVSKSFKDLRGPGVYDDLESERTGGHAMVLVGYDEQRQAFKLINSWSSRWGDKGYGWVSYRAMQKFTPELYVIDAESEAPPAPVLTPPPAVKPAPAPMIVTPPPAPVVVTPPPPPAPVVIAPPPAPVVVAPPPSVVAPPPAPVAIVPPPLKPAAALSAEELQRRADRSVQRLSCARVEARVSPDRSIRLSGFAGSDAELAKLRQDLRALPGAERVEGEITVHPWPQCEVFLNFADALGSGRGLSAQLRGASAGAAFKDRDSLSIEITTPAYPTYVYVTYLQASGEAAHLHWPQGQFPRPIPPNTRLVLGGGAGGQPVYRVGSPFGDEIIVVIASASPLFRDELPDTASDREYLTSFRKAFLVRPKDDSGSRVLSAVALPLRTEP